MDSAADSASPATACTADRPAARGPLRCSSTSLVVVVWFVRRRRHRRPRVAGGRDPPEVTRTSGSATVPSEELVKQVSVDGWFFVIALVAGCSPAYSCWRGAVATRC